MSDATIVVAGATGNLGGRISKSLLEQGAEVKALVRAESDKDKITALRNQGVSIVRADFNSLSELAKACQGASCIVSALSGLREVVVGMQTLLLDAAVEADVPRFIPSDFSIDFTTLPQGTNRNLDLRREFGERLDKTPIGATSILNGMFTDLLNGQAPVILFSLKRVLYWGDADQPLDFTTIDDTASFTARIALQSSTPRILRIAGEVISARGLVKAASETTGKDFRLFRLGGLGALDTLIKMTHAIIPKNDEIFPPWQGMQYLRDMFSGRSKLEPLDNNRYPDMKWTPVREVLALHRKRVDY